MNVNDLALMASAMVGLTVLRFGLPILVTWLVGKAANGLEHVMS
jgi:hypothetical protein